MSSLKDRISEETKSAMRAGDKPRLSALRLILAAIKQHEVDSREVADDAAVQQIIGKMIKKGRDAAAQFEQAGRTDLAARESAEIAVYESFMPSRLSADEVTAAVAAAISATGATSARDMGKVMAHLKAAVGSRADMATLSAQVRAALTSH
jgi:uncharacterized protein YqeY